MENLKFLQNLKPKSKWHWYYILLLILAVSSVAPRCTKYPI